MAPHPATILLATDGSADAAVAEHVAVDLCARSGAALHVVHAWLYVPVGPYPYGGITAAETQRLFEADAARILAASAERIARAGGTVAGQHLPLGSPADAIAQLGEEIAADLIVLGSRGRGPIKRLVLGSVADGVVHTATRPILVLRGGAAAWPPEWIVIGDDGSPTAGAAAALAALLGGFYGARGILVRAYPPLPDRFTMADPLLTPVLPGERQTAAPTAQQLRDELIGQAEQELAARAVALTAPFGTRPEVRVVTSNPAESLLAVADEHAAPTLIAVGSRGLGTFRRLRLGSVSTTILHAAAGPVLIVPPRHEAAATVDQQAGEPPARA